MGCVCGGGRGGGACLCSAQLNAEVGLEVPEVQAVCTQPPVLEGGVSHQASRPEWGLVSWDSCFLGSRRKPAARQQVLRDDMGSGAAVGSGKHYRRPLCRYKGKSPAL